MKIPSVAEKPHNNAFMIFSMLLLGVFLSTIVFLFDFWAGIQGGISFVVIKKIQDSGLGLVWVTSVAGLTLLSVGFFLYLMSFFLLACPVWLIKNKMSSKGNSDGETFVFVMNSVLRGFMPKKYVDNQTHGFKVSFAYLLLTSMNTVNASNIKFLFTQLMFARSLGCIFIFYSGYVCWALGVNSISLLSVCFLVWILAVILYRVGLKLYEVAICSSILIEGLHKEDKNNRQHYAVEDEKENSDKKNELSAEE